MFLGMYHSEIDDKGKLAFPRKWMGELSQGLILTRGIEQSLLVFPVSKFESVARGIDGLGLTSGDVRKWTRFLSALATDLLPDKRGRIIVSPSQLKYAGIVSDVIMVGLLSHIQIWDPPRYEELETKDAPEIIQIAERVDKLIRTHAG